MKRLALLAAPLAAAAFVAASPAPAPAAVLAEDTFTREVATGWDASWSVTLGPTTAFGVSGDAGLVTSPQGYHNAREAHLPAVSSRDVDVTAEITVPALQTTTTRSQNWILVRRQGDGRYIRVGLWADGAGALNVVSQTQAYEQVARDVRAPFTFQPGTYHLRVQLQGASPSVLRTKVWPAGTEEPTAWLQETKTDKGPQVAGTVGVRTVALNTTRAVVTRFEGLVVNDAPVPVADMSQWREVFADDFDGTGLNTTAWSAFNGTGHAGNGLRRPAQVKV